ncbi:hypothetical protein GJ744_002819 [Endocarpon pusillum]|uniref:Uncharacterized protein n=1 Tax=Endocarpon pusillum TaxID=364733 RepID=A0A8H7AS93_9EURO|nr:hypothetical protein GJ744_002819 [Endocarpon pusillum]
MVILQRKDALEKSWLCVLAEIGSARLVLGLAAQPLPQPPNRARFRSIVSDTILGNNSPGEMRAHKHTWRNVLVLVAEIPQAYAEVDLP